MSIVYGITMAIAVFMLIGYLTLIRKKNKWLVLLFVSIAIVNIGYFMLALSKSVEFALIANKIAYFGSIFLPVSMFLTICEITHLKLPKFVLAILGVIAVLIFAIICTTGYLPWYYEEVSLGFADGASKLIKEDGPLHVIYLIYLLGYFVAMVAVTIYSQIKKKVASQKLSVLILVVVFGNIAVWGMEQFIDINFEFLSISYLLSEVVLLGAYWLMQDYELVKKYPQLEKSEEEIRDNDAPCLITQNLTILLENVPTKEELTKREKEVLFAMLENKKRKDIAVELHVSENTIKTHVAHIFDKFNVSSRDEIFSLIKEKQTD